MWTYGKYGSFVIVAIYPYSSFSLETYESEILFLNRPINKNILDFLYRYSCTSNSVKKNFTYLL